MKYKILLLIIPIGIIGSLFFFASETNTTESVLSAESSKSATISASNNDTPITFPFTENRINEKIQNHGTLTILLLGYGGENHAGGYLTDTIILGRLDFSSNTIALLNIPRDLWVEGRKVNAIYADNNNATDVEIALEQLLAIKIDAWATADFNGFREIIDILGGVTINVERAFDDYEYPRHDNDKIDPGVIHLHFDEGEQLMDGERALQYARTRHSFIDGGDFNRSKRQQQILLAIKNEIVKPKNIWRYFSLYSTAKKYFSTNILLNELWSLGNYAADTGTMKIDNKVLSTDDFLYSSYASDGAYILLPRAGNYTEIKAYLDW